MRASHGIIMDLDGTLVDSPLDFAAIRRDLGIPEGAPILEFLESVRAEKRAVLEQRLLDHEWRAANASVLFEGVKCFLDSLKGWGIRTAVFTRNSNQIARHTLGLHGLSVELVVGREDAPPKPDPAGLLKIRDTWGLPGSSLLYLGDYLFDLQAGERAGVTTWLFQPGERPVFASGAAVFFRSYRELTALVKKWGGFQP